MTITGTYWITTAQVEKILEKNSHEKIAKLIESPTSK